MSAPLVPYYRDYCEIGYTYKELTLTGRWKFKTGPDETNALYLECKGFISNWWIHENHVYLLPPRSEVIFECTKQ